MKKIWLLIFSLGMVGAAIYFVINYLFYDISLEEIVPAFKITSKDVKQYLPQDSRSYSPFALQRGYMIDVFADMGRNLPRAFAFDTRGNLLVTSTKSGKVFALPDQNKDGKADKIIEVISGLNKPHGIVFYQDELYVAETNKVVKYTYNPSSYSVSSSEIIVELPGGGKNYTRTIKIFNNKLYISVGSSCNACIEQDPRRASMLVSNLDGSDLKVFAKGLRNTSFFTFDEAGNLWGTDLGREDLKGDLPPDELNLINEGKDYGWPYCYGERVRDSEFLPTENSTYCYNTEPSVYNFQAHTVPLGLSFINSNQFLPSEYGNLLVSLHGSSKTAAGSGYKIIYLTVFGGVLGRGVDFLSGFQQNGDILGRPVDLIFDKEGNLYISDDYASLIYILKRG